MMEGMCKYARVMTSPRRLCGCKKKSYEFYKKKSHEKKERQDSVSAMIRLHNRYSFFFSFQISSRPSSDFGSHT